MAEDNRKVVIELQNVKRYFQVGSETVKALRGVSFKIYEGEFVTIQGTSGSGKSTLLNQLGCLDTPTSGEYYLDGISVRSMSKTQRARLRNRKIGFVFQNYNLLAKTTALENVELAQQVCPNALNPAEVMRQVGLGDRMNNFPAQLSGGEQQRVSIARALCKNPALLLCDEPTGALDSKTGEQVLELLTRLCRDYSTTVVIITHNAAIAPLGNRIIRLKNGTVQEVTVNEHPIRVEEIQW